MNETAARGVVAVGILVFFSVYLSNALHQMPWLLRSPARRAAPEATSSLPTDSTYTLLARIVAAPAWGAREALCYLIQERQCVRSCVAFFFVDLCSTCTAPAAVTHTHDHRAQEAPRPATPCSGSCARPSSPSFGTRRRSSARPCSASTRATTAPCTRGSAARARASPAAPCRICIISHHTASARWPHTYYRVSTNGQTHPSFLRSRQVSMGSALDCVWYMSLKPLSVRPLFSSHWK